MNLSDFIARAVGFFDKAEKNLTDGDASKARVAELEKQVQDLNKTVEARDATIKDLQGKLDKAGVDLVGAQTEAKDFKGKFEAEEKRVTETLAKMGVDPKTIPAGKPATGAAAGSNASTAILAEYDAISEPQARTAFFRANKAKILAAHQAAGRS